ncbi:MAG: phosphopentomutase [Christensenellales bacterium]|jgi:phosphopentomutase
MNTILMVIDGFGLGAYPDALNKSVELYGKILKSAKIPALVRLGINNLNNPRSRITPMASYGYLKSVSMGTDIITLYFEMAGLHIKTLYPTYPEGLPQDVIRNLERRLNTNLIGNIVVDGKRLINDLGALHYNTGFPIIYTSRSSVIYLAAHEEIIPLDKLYEMCGVLRSELTNKHNVARIMASPFNGKINDFNFTDNNRCYTVLPPAPTMLDVLSGNGIAVHAVGKINEIFNGQGITRAYNTRSNDESFNEINKLLQSEDNSFIFAGIETADLSRNDDIKVYINSVEEIDRNISRMLTHLKPDDLLIISSNHSFESSYSSTDNGYLIPLIVYGGRIRPGINLNTIDGLYSVAHTILDYHGFSKVSDSFLLNVIKP